MKYWFSNSVSLTETDFFKGWTDCHSHFLWGVDDGIQTEQETLDALRYYESLGIECVCFTPHIMNDLHANTADALQQRFAQLQQNYHGSLRLQLGAEYMLDEGFEKHVDCGPLLTVMGTCVLVETFSQSPPLELRQIIFRLQNQNHNVLMAHPERYRYSTLDCCKRLKDMGVLLQLNLLSLLGAYGNIVRQKATKLLTAGLYDCVGSDLHNLNVHRQFYEKRELSPKIAGLLTELAKCGTGRQ
jgi:tyrosine-protein phosphatase YwqE